MSTHFVKCVFILLASTTAIDCSSPCSGDIITLRVSDTDNAGSVIGQLNGTDEVILVNCLYLRLDQNNSIVLNISLRNPCIEDTDTQCQLKCGLVETRWILLDISKADIYPPSFELPIYYANVSENANIGTEVFCFQSSSNVTDQDCGIKEFNYDLEKTNVPFKFGNNALGNLLLDETLNYEVEHLYILNVSVENGVRFGYTTLEIRVTDVDDRNPQFTYPEYQLNITEETITEGWLFTDPPVLCFDGDSGINATIYYSFSGGSNSSEYFEMNTTNGSLLQAKSINREHTSALSLGIICYQADNPTKTASAAVHITVLDINDNLPIFNPTSYDVSLVENAYGYVITVVATDQDQGINGEFLYQLSSNINVFAIDETSGVITVKDPGLLDREMTPNLQFEVVAVDAFGNFSVNNASVLVTLLDVNDNTPKFSLDIYTFRFNFTETGSVVGTINATDDDEEHSGNSNITYSIHSSWNSGIASQFPLILDEISGDIVLIWPVLPSHEYSMIVEACDNPAVQTDRRCDFCQTIAVYTSNITTVFETTISLEVMENLPVNTLIELIPVIGDKYNVSIPQFYVDQISHVLKTAVVLDREIVSKYKMNILVESYANGVVGNISIDLHVLDENDNAPRFSQEEYFFTLPEQRPSLNSIVGFLQSEDADVNENSNRTYSFSRSSYLELFFLDPVSGNITLLNDFWFSTQTMFILTAMVEDHGIPSLRSVVPIYISHMKAENVTVRVSTPAIKNIIDDSKADFEVNLASILGYSSVHIEQVTAVTSDIVSVKSYIFLSANFANSTNVPVPEVQREVALKWSAIQDLFKQSIAYSALINEDTLQTAEIALIAVAAVVFLGAGVTIFIVCRQWNIHIKHHRLYQHMSHHNAIYDSQELKVEFGDENFSSRHSTFRSNTRPKEPAEVQETSFGYNYINPVFTDDDGNPIKMSSLSGNTTPRVPRWSTSDSLKDAIASLEDLTNRLNSEDNISRVSNMSRGRYSEKSLNDDQDGEIYIMPQTDYPNEKQTEDSAILVHSDMLECIENSQSDGYYVQRPVYSDEETLRDSVEVNAPNGDLRNSDTRVVEASTAF